MSNKVIDSTVAKDVENEGGITMVYTFRKLEARDVFPMFKILGKIGVNEFADLDVSKIMSKVGENGASNINTAVGISVLLEITNVVLNNLPKCEKEIFQLLSDTSNLTVDQVRSLDFGTFTSMVIDFIQKEEFLDFIKVVSRLFKSKK